MSFVLARFWRVRDFRLLWAGHSNSMLGSQITPVVLPLIAAVTRGATPAQMALLQALQRAPGALLGLFAGVWVDRLRRRSAWLCVAARLAAEDANAPSYRPRADVARRRGGHCAHCYA